MRDVSDRETSIASVRKILTQWLSASRRRSISWAQTAANTSTPDCGFWMQKRSVADAKMEALVKGRNLFEGCTTEAELTDGRVGAH